MLNLAPIIIFCYKRLDTLEQTINSLQKNYLSNESDLFIYSDAAKSENDINSVDQVRDYIHKISGFKTITIIEAEKNKGLANSIIDGVTEVINKYNKVIVLEDDLKLSSNFLKFMNDALNLYENNQKVFSISGFIFDIKYNHKLEYDVFFTNRHCSWGWAMWRDRWNEIDWDVKDYKEFQASKKMQNAFNKISGDLSSTLEKQIKGAINSWAIRCNYHQFKKQTFTVYPLRSKVVNIGFGKDATHTKQKFNRYYAKLDDQIKYEFKFPDNVIIDEILLKKFKNKYSFFTRAAFHLLNKMVR